MTMRLLSLLLSSVTQTAALFFAFVFVHAHLWWHVAFQGGPNQSPAADRAEVALIVGFGLALLVGGVIAFLVGRGLCTLAGTMVLTAVDAMLNLTGLSPSGLFFPALTGAAVGLIAASSLLERAGLLGVGVGLAVAWTLEKVRGSVGGSAVQWVEATEPYVSWILVGVLAMAVGSVALSFAARPGNQRWATGGLELL
ncbi:hypothetical protein [Streptomyces sp. NPDC060131]|uniref:hypothetical protein n=1 Tax=unclassified Streptomyces TaxID=2593676 RepID=UPI00364FAD3F